MPPLADFLSSLGAQTFAIIVGLLIGGALFVLRRWLNARNQPLGAERRRLLTDLARMQSEGTSYAERLDFLRRAGLRPDVARALLEDAARSEPAATSNPLRLERSGLAFDYPSNWRLQTIGPELDPQRAFAVEGRNSALVMFLLPDATMEKAADVEEQAAAQSATMSDCRRASFSRWGAYTGHGIELHGLRQGHPTRVRVFANGASPRFCVVEGCLEEDLTDAAPGFSLIERTLRTQA